MTKLKKTATSAKGAPGLAEARAGLSHPVTPEQRHHYVEVAAYYIAERRVHRRTTRLRRRMP